MNQQDKAEQAQWQALFTVYRVRHAQRQAGTDGIGKIMSPIRILWSFAWQEGEPVVHCMPVGDGYSGTRTPQVAADIL